MHFIIWLCSKSIGWLLFTLKKAQVWKDFQWNFQNFAFLHYKIISANIKQGLLFRSIQNIVIATPCQMPNTNT
jgi:hypothetical protein